VPPRYEFRVFGRRLAAERKALARCAAADGEDDPRTDTYFVVPKRADASLKLRDATLDLKLLRCQEDGLELWLPAGRADFPVAPATLRSGFLAPAGLQIDLPDRPVDRDLLIGLASAAPGPVRLVRIDKRRSRFRIAGAPAEFTRLSVDDEPLETVAVEESDRERALAAVAALGLSGRRNTSYQRFLVGRLFETGR
jgi:hypothetical protein